MCNKLILILLLCIYCCSDPGYNSKNQADSLKTHSRIEIENPIISSRDSILTNLKIKIEKKEPIVIHIFVALYGYNTMKSDDVEDWADGTNPKANLYWGAGFGIKTYFKKYDNWKLIFDKENISKSIFERVVFKKTFSNGAIVYLIADAYAGYEMQTCLNSYFSAISEKNIDSVDIENKKIPANGNANLIVFNGHNGLMDYEIQPEIQKCKRLKETMVIACNSAGFFKNHIKKCYCFPLITTRGLVPAEAYILGSIIEPWILLKSEEEIRESLISKYIKIQKCSQEDADYLFTTNW